MKNENKTKNELLKEMMQLSQRIQHLSIYKTQFVNLPLKVFSKDKNLNYVACNENFARDFKITPDELTGKTDFDIFPRELAEKYRADDKRLIKTGNKEEIDECYMKDGKENYVHTVKKPVFDEDGAVAGIIGVFWDITKRKLAEKETERERMIVTAINDIFRKAITCQTEEELASTCLDVAEKLTGSKFGFIGELNSAGLFDTLAISNPGWDKCNIPPDKARLVITNMQIRGIDRSILREGKSRIVNGPELMTHPDRVGLPEGHPPITSFLGVPLKHGGKITGMIALANKKPEYDEEDKEAVEKISTAIVEALRSKRAEQAIARQSQEILDISTPVLQVMEGVVVAPLIGTIDSQRTQQFMDRFLTAIVDTNSPVGLIDITGVPTLDTQTAQHLIEAVTATTLLGTKVIVTGIRPAIAQTLVHLGIDLSTITTKSSLASGLREALAILNMRIVKGD